VSIPPSLSTFPPSLFSRAHSFSFLSPPFRDLDTVSPIYQGLGFYTSSTSSALTASTPFFPPPPAVAAQRARARFFKALVVAFLIWIFVGSVPLSPRLLSLSLSYPEKLNLFTDPQGYLWRWDRGHGGGSRTKRSRSQTWSISSSS